MGARPVLEQILMPAVKNRRLEAVLFAQVRDRNLVDQMTPQKGELFLSSIMLLTFPPTASSALLVENVADRAICPMNNITIRQASTPR